MFFVIGARDPEMEYIVQHLLRDAHVPWVAAVDAQGRNVHPGNAYAADIKTLDGMSGPVVFVECDVPGAPVVPVAICDHHRLGDPGFGRPPAEFLPASSVGQVASLLARNGWIPTWPGGRAREGHRLGQFTHENDGRWYLTVESPEGDQDLWDVAVPQDLLIVAAADHCLTAAYRGLCPGVDPEVLEDWRAGNRAAHQGRTVNEVLADVARAALALRTAPLVTLGKYNVVDMRGLGHVAELPEAAAREGLCFVSQVKDRDNRIKVVCQAGNAEQIAAFLAWAPSQGITDLYGDPARGFAGGYLKGDVR